MQNWVKSKSKVILSGVRTLRFRLFLAFVLVGSLPLFLLWSIVSRAIDDHLIQEQLSNLRSNLTTFATHVGTIQGYMTSSVVQDFRRGEFGQTSEALSSRIVVANTMSNVLYDSQQGLMEGRQWPSPLMMTALDEMHSYDIAILDDSVVISIAVAIVNEENSIIGVVKLEHNMPEAGALIAGINNQVLWLLGIIAAIVVVLVFIIVSWFVRPLRRVLIALRYFSEGHFSRRIAVKGNDEISAIGIAFNDMAQKLETVETARQEFVSNVSHELKTPLSSIKVLSESLLLQKDADIETHREFLTDINSEVDRMADIVNELLTLVRLDETDLPLNISSLNLNELIRGCIKRLTPLANQKDVVIQFPPSRNVIIDGDEMKLVLAISNLIENAVKYSHPKGEPVKIQLKSDAKNAYITIADSGIGIGEEDQSKIFSRFYRADKGRDRETGGTGLGLAITHKTILLHNGGIRLASNLGEGSIFTVRLPINAPS
ncbi:MAG: HAMP domain-containing histidine kinase [Defluviitaleaceae bacterium]|nr:HAMP domain-containing histidine kinase [Defluviitaleaceae bacterium]